MNWKSTARRRLKHELACACKSQGEAGGEFLIASEVQLCSSCGHPVKEKEGRWKHTNAMDGHVFTTVHCQECIAAGKECSDPRWDPNVTVPTKGESTAKPVKPEESFLICKVCGIYARNRAALMRHFRDEHPLDPERLLSLQREGKSIEEMAVILERTPQTVRYHLERLSSDSEPAGHQSVQLEMQSSPDRVAVSGTADLESENRDLRARIRGEGPTCPSSLKTAGTHNSLP